MRKRIRCVLDDVVLDLSEPDLGHSDGLDILQYHYRQSDQSSPEFSQAHPAFICLDHEGGTNPGLRLRKVNGEWHAVHDDAGDCRDHRLPAPMSDEHKRQTEYWARAARDFGWDVELEHALHTGSRPDALIRGPVTTGIEVQRSAMAPGRAVDRTAKASSAGVTDVWYSDWTLPPKWAWRVPSVLSREHGMEASWDRVDWTTVPPRRAVRAVGLRQVDPAKCTMVNFSRCPHGRNWCGQWHPKARYWAGLSVDDVAAQLPAGNMVLLSFHGVRIPGQRDRKAVFIVPPAGRDLYTELTGWSGAPSFLPERQDRPPREPGIWGINQQTPMWCETCDRHHPVIEHRDCRAAEEPWD